MSSCFAVEWVVSWCVCDSISSTNDSNSVSVISVSCMFAFDLFCNKVVLECVLLEFESLSILS